MAQCLNWGVGGADFLVEETENCKILCSKSLQLQSFILFSTRGAGLKADSPREGELFIEITWLGNELSSLINLSHDASFCYQAWAWQDSR